MNINMVTLLQNIVIVENETYNVAPCGAVSSVSESRSVLYKSTVAINWVKSRKCNGLLPSSIAVLNFSIALDTSCFFQRPSPSNQYRLAVLSELNHF